MGGNLKPEPCNACNAAVSEREVELETWTLPCYDIYGLIILTSGVKPLVVQKL